MLKTAPPAEQAFLFDGVDWEFYDALLASLRDRPVFVTYDHGSLELMFPSRNHESAGRLIARMIDALTEELNIPVAGCKSTTFRRRDIERGLGPDECYYIKNEARVRGRRELDLPRDPPPDLAVEIEISHRVLDREVIYAALGVPELWRHDGQRLQVYCLGPDAQYLPCDRSPSLPMLPPADVDRFLTLAETTDETTWIRGFRAWVRQHLLPGPGNLPTRPVE
ncbi:MAG: Uma2 family endonuclease [Planctomycetes bacterium]|nr:Uma2 family endonuclease [Planctomycetota bacterium]